MRPHDVPVFCFCRYCNYDIQSIFVTINKLNSIEPGINIYGERKIPTLSNFGHVNDETMLNSNVEQMYRFYIRLDYKVF